MTLCAERRRRRDDHAHRLRRGCRPPGPLVEATPDDALEQATPCTDYTVGDLLDHIAGSVAAFRAAATKDPLPGGPSGDAANLPAEWRTRMAADVLALAEAWCDPVAWTGMTAAGGVDLPGDVAGVIALDELVIHGWDLAKALGQPAGYDGPGLDAVLDRVQQLRASGAEGLFGPEVRVPDDAVLFDRLLGIAGRDPGWKPPGRDARS